MVRYLPLGEDFGPKHFAEASFGFSKSARTVPDNNRAEAKGVITSTKFTPQEGKMAKGGRIRRAEGGPANDPSNQQQTAVMSAAQQIVAANPTISLQQAVGMVVAQMGGAGLQQQPSGMKRGGRIRRAIGGVIPGPSPASGAAPLTRPQTQTPVAGNPLAKANVTMPVGDLANLATGAVKLGATHAVNTLAQAGQRIRQVARPVAMPGAAAMSPAAQAPPPATAGLQGVAGASPGLRNGGRIRRNTGGPMGAVPAPMPAASPRPGAMPGMAKGGHLTAAARHALPKSDFALPGERYPIEDKNHARNALARVSQHGSPSEQSRVRAAVHRKFPGVGQKKG